jgi:hypothetical protein
MVMPLNPMQTAAATAPLVGTDGTINADRLLADIEDFRDRIIGILRDGQDFSKWCGMVVTPEAFAANRIVAWQAPAATDGTGAPLGPGGMAPVGQETYQRLLAGIATITMLARMLDTPLEGQERSIEDAIFAQRAKWRGAR